MFLAGQEQTVRARDQRLHYLEINSNKPLYDRAENVHFEKYLGVAEMTPEALLDFCKRHYPDKYDSFAQEMKDHPETVYLDIENLFSKLEELPIYQSLLDVVRRGTVLTIVEKSWLALFLTHHVLRSHVYLNSLVEAYKEEGMQKFEALVKLKWSLEDPMFMAPEGAHLVESYWTIYKINRSILPLSDAPIVGAPSGTLYATLAPNMLLVVEQRRIRGLGIGYANRIPTNLYRECLRTTIDHTHKGLIFSDKKSLMKCQNTTWWQKRRKAFLSE